MPLQFSSTQTSPPSLLDIYDLDSSDDYGPAILCDNLPLVQGLSSFTHSYHITDAVFLPRNLTVLEYILFVPLWMISSYSFMSFK